MDRVVDARCPGGQAREDEVAELCGCFALGQVERKGLSQIINVCGALQLWDPSREHLFVVVVVVVCCWKSLC